MPHRSPQLFIFFVLASLLLFATEAFAQPAQILDPNFNPSYIISDAELQDYGSMTRSDIQAFLEENGGALSHLSLADASGTMRQASDIIYRAATDHRINPKYLLVKLQKEQSLVTAQSPTQRQLDWATGYGVCDSCSTDDPNLQKFRGFGTQVDSAGGVIRWYYDNVAISPIIKKPNSSYLIDNTLVQPLNLATAFLYTYTPHIHGNYNFWKLWRRWFEQFYPDGTLVKAPDSATVYLLNQGQKRPFGSETALKSRFDANLIITIPAIQLARYETGTTITLPNYSVVKLDGQYYLLDFDLIRPFANPAVVNKLGYNPDEIISVSSTDLAAFTTGTIITADNASPLGRMAKVKESQALYYLSEGIYHPVSDIAVARNRFPNLALEEVPAATLATYTPGPPLLFKDGTLMGTKATNKIYVIEHGHKRHIPDEASFKTLGYNANTVIWTDEFTELNHPTGQPISLPKINLLADSEEDAIPQPPNSLPVNPVMIAVSEKKTVYVGAKFDTTVNTYLVADAKTGKILAGKNIDAVRPMASFAKVVTAYRLLKEGLSLAKNSTYKPKEHKATYNNFRIAAGEKVRNEDLMESMLVSSVNTPANMLVAQVEKIRKNFVKRLNRQARDWGLKKTSFSDPNGEAVDTKTTAREYLTLFRKATKNADLQRILGLASYEYNEVVDKDGKPTHYDNNTNALMRKANLPFRILMSKTGYLDEAGAGLVMSIERNSDKKQFILITMGNPDNQKKFDEPERLARWAIANL